MIKILQNYSQKSDPMIWDGRKILPTSYVINIETKILQYKLGTSLTDKINLELNIVKVKTFQFIEQLVSLYHYLIYKTNHS